MSVNRCFCHHGADPFFNMAFDECMLGHVLLHEDDILLRLYTWNPAAITIGVHQNLDRAVRLSRLGTTPLIRRITGGRAVYHDVSELTYSIALNRRNSCLRRWPASVQALYLRLADGLRLFLAETGVSAQLVRTTPGGHPEKIKDVLQPCFASVARYELTTGGTKIVASAQRQVGSAVLQHGSIKLNGTVGHPALGEVKSGSADVGQPIELPYVERMSTQFATVFSRVLGVEIKRPDPHTPILPDGLDARRRLIQMTPLAARDPFEHSPIQDSL